MDERQAIDVILRAVARIDETDASIRRARRVSILLDVARAVVMLAAVVAWGTVLWLLAP